MKKKKDNNRLETPTTTELDLAEAAALDADALHLNGEAFENLEAPQQPVNHDRDNEVQEKFSGDDFYASGRALKKMRAADQETAKFNAQTLEARINPDVNHDRSAEI